MCGHQNYRGTSIVQTSGEQASFGKSKIVICFPYQRMYTVLYVPPNDNDANSIYAPTSIYENMREIIVTDEKQVKNVVRDIILSRATEILVYNTDNPKKRRNHDKHLYNSQAPPNHNNPMLSVYNNSAVGNAGKHQKHQKHKNNERKTINNEHVFSYSLGFIREINRLLLEYVNRNKPLINQYWGLEEDSIDDLFKPLVIDLLGIYEPQWVCIAREIHKSLKTGQTNTKEEKEKMLVVIEREKIPDPVTIATGNTTITNKIINMLLADEDVTKLIVKNHKKRTVFKAVKNKNRNKNRNKNKNKLRNTFTTHKILINNINYKKTSLWEKTAKKLQDYRSSLSQRNYETRCIKEQIVFTKDFFEDLEKFAELSDY